MLIVDGGGRYKYQLPVYPLPSTCILHISYYARTLVPWSLSPVCPSALFCPITAAHISHFLTIYISTDLRYLHLSLPVTPHLSSTTPKPFLLNICSFKPFQFYLLWHLGDIWLLTQWYHDIITRSEKNAVSQRTLFSVQHVFLMFESQYYKISILVCGGGCRVVLM